MEKENPLNQSEKSTTGIMTQADIDEYFGGEFSIEDLRPECVGEFTSIIDRCEDYISDHMAIIRDTYQSQVAKMFEKPAEDLPNIIPDEMVRSLFAETGYHAILTIDSKDDLYGFQSNSREKTMVVSLEIFRDDDREFDAGDVGEYISGIYIEYNSQVVSSTEDMYMIEYTRDRLDSEMAELKSDLGEAWPAIRGKLIAALDELPQRFLRGDLKVLFSG